jgi:hypothetical protein
MDDDTLIASLAPGGIYLLAYHWKHVRRSDIEKLIAGAATHGITLYPIATLDVAAVRLVVPETTREAQEEGRR